MIFIMKQYTFLYKPLFYIFSLLFATWLVTEVEKISPSDDSLKQTAIKETGFSDPQKYLLNVCCAYKAGVIDSAALNHKLTFFLKSAHSSPE